MSSSEAQQQQSRCRPWCSILRRRSKAASTTPKFRITKASEADCEEHNQSDDETSILAKLAAVEHSGDLCKSSPANGAN